MDNIEAQYDLVVVGSGAAGLSAAVTAAHHGLKVAVVEKASVMGGASAWSGGWMWVPRNFLAREAGIKDDVETVRSYLRHELGEHFNSQRVDAFLFNAPKMAEFFHQNTALQFDDGNAIADIHSSSPGAGTGGRSLIATAYDGRKLGKHIKLLRKTMDETSVFGMPIQAGRDLWAFLNCMRSVGDFLYVAGRMTRHFRDLLLYGRAMQLVNGVALIGRLARSALDLKVDCYVSAPARELVVKDGRVVGVKIDSDAGEQTLLASRAVLLAAGGFAHDVSRRQRYFARTPTGHEHWPLPPPSTTGDGLNMAEAVGAGVAEDLYSGAAWAPVSLVPQGKGRFGHFPHIIERAKPGVIGVLADGKRFVNEAGGYFDYVDAMIRKVPAGEEVASWLVCSHRFQRRYGLGISRPFPLPFRHWIRRGYLKSGNTIEKLASRCGIDPQGLKQTITEYNQHASKGEDPLFGRGSTPYNCKNGDPSQLPNPCVATIDQGPFYAVKVVPGSFGTFVGLKTNGRAQVLRDNGDIIDGLYAAGCDMASIMGGKYPAGGINLGPAMTFGYIAAMHAAGQNLKEE